MRNTITSRQAHAQIKEIRQYADLFRARVQDEARQLSFVAGLNPKNLWTDPQNALRSLESGRPWADVDYRIVRKVDWLLKERQHQAHRIAAIVITRLLKRTVWASP